MAYKLYNAPQSTCSQRVRFVFNGKKILFDEVNLNLLEGDQLKPDYLKLNPNGVVPTLDHVRAHPAFRPTYYPGSLLSERFPHLRKRVPA
jgi:glutathione S-transferase